MDGWVIALIVVVGVVALIVVLQALGAIDLRDKRRHSGSAGAFVAIDEVFFPTRAEAFQEQARQAALPAPAPLPGDRGRMRADLEVDESRGYRGRIRLDLDA